MLRNPSSFPVIVTALLALPITQGCTDRTPDYCDTSTPCVAGFRCDFEARECVAVSDGSSVADKGIDPDGRSGHDAVHENNATQCGNGSVDPGEECDKTDLDGETCETQGFDGGNLGCDVQCTFDTTACHKCGDGVKNGNEDCDQKDTGAKSCQGFGFASGTLACRSDCTLSMKGCVTSGWVTVPAGSFSMGSPTSEPCRDPGDETEHQVLFKQGLEASPNETTQAEFQAAMGYNPSFFGTCGNSCPVDSVSWHEAAAYCNKLSASRSLPECYSCSGSGASVKCANAAVYAAGAIYDCPGYRLPTDAEWEYMYRAGKATALYNGLITSCASADSNVDAIAWYNANSSNATHPVAQKQGNTWGFYDLGGNVYEWCHDWYQADLGSAAVTNPWGPKSATGRTIRGGSYKNSSASIRAASRNSFDPSDHHSSIGFRCVRTL